MTPKGKKERTLKYRYMEKFSQITKKYFCETLSNYPSILVSAGMANEYFIEDRSNDIILACESINANNDNTRTGKLKSNCIEFKNKHDEISRLYFDQTDTKYTFYNLENIYICRIHYNSIDKCRYIIYKTI